MTDLLTAAKAVIYDWDKYQIVHCESVNMLCAAVERAENQDVKNAADFIGWASTVKGVNPVDGWVDFGFDAWTAAQQAERERCREIVITMGGPDVPDLLRQIDSGEE